MGYQFQKWEFILLAWGLALLKEIKQKEQVGSSNGVLGLETGILGQIFENLSNFLYVLVHMLLSLTGLIVILYIFFKGLLLLIVEAILIGPRVGVIYDTPQLFLLFLAHSLSVTNLPSIVLQQQRKQIFPPLNSQQIQIYAHQNYRRDISLNKSYDLCVMVLYYIIFISLFFVPMSNQPKVKSPPKVVSISLQSPQKKKKEPSPPINKDPFNSPLSSLKKTFNTSKNTYSHIQANHQQKIFEHEQQKKQEKYLREQQIADQQNHPKLTEKQLRTCRKLFQILDRDNKGYIVYEDLRQMGKTDTQIVGIVRKVFVRKEQNSFFDFVYGLWDTESLGRLVGCVEGE